MQPYTDVHSSHMSAAATHAPTSAAPSSMSHYYPPQQQPSILPPQPQYSQPPASYQSYGYGNGVPSQLPASSAMSNSLVPALPLPAMSSSVPAPVGGSQQYPPHNFDHTGQVAPPGMKPRVTATLWEDEGSLCFQVEAKGVCVARREDNHMINGTKLLNVAGMTRGRRDGILKSEKTRHVVKIGPMHLKGVWIPFERALEFANKEKITEQLYPLFVHDIGALLYHPSNQSRTGTAGMAAMDRARNPAPMHPGRFIPGPSNTSQPQPQSHHHHHSMSHTMGPTPGHSIPSHSAPGRPGLDRAHSFPTPPTSATPFMGHQSGAYEWNQQANVQGMQGNQPLSIDTGVPSRSIPNTPASTPPGTVQAGMTYPTAPNYDTSRQVYSTASSQPPQYQTQGQPLMNYRQEPNYPKPEMAPPARAHVGPEQQDVKPAEGILPQEHDPGNHAQEADPEPEQENEYTHSNSTYSGRSGPYSYSASGAPASIHGEHAHLSPEGTITGSPHQNGSGRATPRTTATGQPQWSTGYAPQRQQGGSNLYSVMSDSRATTNGNAPQESYQPNPAQQYSSQGYPQTNGLTSMKRGRDDDDEQDPYGRPASQAGDDIDGLKRRKTITEGSNGSVGSSPYNRDPNAGMQRNRPSMTPQRNASRR